MQNKKAIRVAVFQRICPHYRVPVFAGLSKRPQIDLTLFFGKGTKHGGLNNAKGFHGIKIKKLFTVLLNFRVQKKDYSFILHPTAMFEIFKKKYDVVICEGASNIINNIFIILACKIRNIPVIWWGPGVLNSKKSFVHQLFFPLEKFLIRQSKACMAYSTSAKKYFADITGTEDNVFIAPNSIDDNKIREDVLKYKKSYTKYKESLSLNGNKIILYTGSITQRKNIESLILAFSDIVKTNPDISLLIMGQGPHLDTLKKWTELRKVPNVIFLGSIWETAAAYFLMADLFVLPSHGGLAINEAMAYGLPVIASTADGTSEDLIINGVTGYLIEEGNVEELRKTIEKVLFDEELLNIMNKNTKDLIENKINLDKMLDGISEAIIWAKNNAGLIINEN